MKKLSLIIGLIILLAAPGAIAQSFEKGNSVISAGYGIGSISKMALNVLRDKTGLERSFTGPFFVKYEYGIADNIGLGLNIAHFGAKATWTTTVQDQTYNGRLDLRNTSVMARLNIHFANSEKFDAYWGAGIGVKGGVFRITDTSPNTPNIPLWNIPFAFETTFGARYFVIPNLGVYAELGMAKAILQFGLVGKF